jgi:hypothetical protein
MGESPGPPVGRGLRPFVVGPISSAGMITDGGKAMSRTMNVAYASPRFCTPCIRPAAGDRRAQPVALLNRESVLITPPAAIQARHSTDHRSARQRRGALAYDGPPDAPEMPNERTRCSVGRPAGPAARNRRRTDGSARQPARSGLQSARQGRADGRPIMHRVAHRENHIASRCYLGLAQWTNDAGQLYVVTPPDWEATLHKRKKAGYRRDFWGKDPVVRAKAEQFFSRVEDDAGKLLPDLAQRWPMQFGGEEWCTTVSLMAAHRLRNPAGRERLDNAQRRVLARVVPEYAPRVSPGDLDAFLAHVTSDAFRVGTLIGILRKAVIGHASRFNALDAHRIFGRQPRHH